VSVADGTSPLTYRIATLAENHGEAGSPLFVVDFPYPYGYNYCMIVLRQTETFSRWLSRLTDQIGRARILARLKRIRTTGNMGDVKPVGEGISEIRVDMGPGYRLYFTRRENMVIFLLCGGDKSTQDRDISRARELAKTLE
jgi:putative addiction module killer protein